MNSLLANIQLRISERDKPNSLCINLVDIGHSLRQDVARHLVSVFVFKFGGFSASAVHTRSGICYGASHDTADRRRNFEDVGDGRRINQSVLGDRQATSHDRIVAA